MKSPRDRLEHLWRRLAPLPGGRWLFARIFGWAVPYSNTIGAEIGHLEPGLCRTTLPDRRRIRNHLSSVHAVALVNLGEMTSGLAMTLALPSDVRGIVTEIAATYSKKGRGTLTAEARVTVPAVGVTPVETPVETLIRDGDGATVCRVRTVWRLERAQARAG